MSVILPNMRWQMVDDLMRLEYTCEGCVYVMLDKFLEKLFLLRKTCKATILSVTPQIYKRKPQHGGEEKKRIQRTDNMSLQSEEINKLQIGPLASLNFIQLGWQH